MERHPGGRDMIILGQGRDSTGMFYSYHRDPAKAEAVLSKLPELDSSLLPACEEMDAFDFKSKTYEELRERVNTYFKTNNLNSRGGLYMLAKSVALIMLYAFTYYLSLFWGWLFLCPLVGILSSSLGLCIQHDANHGSFSSSQFINRIFAFCDDIIGGSGIMWRHQHCVAHHIFCNDVKKDNDTKSQFPLMRMNPALPHREYLRYQHIYGLFLYSLIGISFPIGDLLSFLSGKYADVDLHPLSLIDKATFYIGKAVHLTLFFLIPCYVLGISFLWKWYLPLELVGGVWLAGLFAVSHNNSACLHNYESEDWALMQIRTSANWASDSLMWNIMSGGLNCQIEHHLFPGICHVHYPALTKIVRQYCKEKNIPYNAYPTFTEIFVDHIAFLKKMGQKHVE